MALLLSWGAQTGTTLKLNPQSDKHLYNKLIAWVMHILMIN